MKALIDYGPLVAFFVAYYVDGLMAATAAVMVATLAAIALAYVTERRVPLVPVMTGAIVLVFGGLTLWLNDETFIKLKPTLVNLLFAAALGVGLMLRRHPLKALFGAVFQLTEAGWRGLALRWMVFFLAMAALNELVWRTQSTELWVNFKVFGIVALTIAFTLAQLPYLRRHAPAEPAPPA